MATVETSGSKRSYFRFSLTTLLVVCTCICCFFAGEKIGYRRGLQLWNSVPVYMTSYSVSDLSFDKLDIKDADELVAKVKKEIAPSAWEDAGGNCICKLAKPIGGKERHLVVGANVYIHDELKRLLDASRTMTVAAVPIAGVPTVVTMPSSGVVDVRGVVEVPSGVAGVPSD